MYVYSIKCVYVCYRFIDKQDLFFYQEPEEDKSTPDDGYAIPLGEYVQTQSLYCSLKSF